MKKNDTNAKTEYSRKQRAATATKYNAKLRKKGLLSQINLSGPTEDIERFREGLKDIKGSSNLERCLFLIDFYEENKK